MTPARMIQTMSVLLIGTGILHLVVAAIGSPPDLRLGLAVFGVAYTGLGFWVRSGGRTSVLVTLIVTALGLGVGGTAYLQNGGPITLPVMFLIDFVVLGLGGMWMMKTQKS